MKRILHLDDSQMALRMMERILKDCAEVLSVATVHDAEAILAKESVDMVITDYLLDDGNGLDFTRRLRSEERYKNIPILLVSASMSNDVAFEGRRAGVNQSFRKPLHPAEMRQAVAKQLKSPWIEDVQRSRLHLHGVSWETGGLHYEYSPDLNHRVSAPSSEQAHQEMTQQLKTLVGGQMNFEEVPKLHIVEYDLDVE